MLRACNICMDIVTKYLMATNVGDDLEAKSGNLKTLASVFSKYGGVLGKVAQTLSLENKDSDVFDESKPYASKQTNDYVLDVLSKSIEFSDITILPDIYKNGSLGQVYKGIYEEKDIIIKVKYEGVDEQTRGDFQILDMLIKYLGYQSSANAMIDIKERMLEELDYNIEALNQTEMRELYKDDENIVIPFILDKFTSGNTIVMEYMEGFQGFNDFIKNSNQDDRNVIGNLLLKFIFESIYKHGLYYSDNHYGNFLVKDSSKLCILDFGCLGRFDLIMIHKIQAIHRSLYLKNQEIFYETMEMIGVITTETSVESREYCYEFFTLQYQPLIEDNFVFSDEWVDRAGCKNTVLMKEWVLPKNFIYLHKIPYGLYHVLGKLKMTVNCGEYLYDTYIR
jgi:tRNA A-37 threonylcarbamoyl transferase component Bud32